MLLKPFGPETVIVMLSLLGAVNVISDSDIVLSKAKLKRAKDESRGTRVSLLIMFSFIVLGDLGILET